MLPHGEKAVGARETADNDRPYSIKWNSGATFAAAGISLGIEQGLFSRSGLSLHLDDGVSDLDTATAVARDDRTIGQVSASGFLRARSMGLAVVAFAASYLSNSTEIYTLNETRIQSPFDLLGKTIAYNPSTDCGFIFDALVRRYGLGRSGLKIVETQAGVERLLDGTVDVMIGHWELEGKKLRQSGASFQAVTPDDFGIHVPGSIFIVSERAIALRPEAIDSFLVGLLDAWEVAYARPDQLSTIPDRRIFGETDAAQIAESMARQRAYLRPLGTRMGEIDKGRFRELNYLLLAQQLIARQVDLGSAIDTNFITEAHRRRSRAINRDHQNNSTKDQN